MAEGNVQLRLKATLDLDFLRAQVASLGKTLKTGGVSVVATLNTKQFEKDVAKLRKEVRVNINDTQVVAARLRLGKLSQSLATLRRATASPIEIKVKYIQEGKTPAGLASEKRGTFRQRLEAVNPAEIKRLYQSAAEAGIVAFDQQTARSKSKIVTSLSRAGEDAISGLLNGVKSKNADVRAAAKGLGDDLIRALKNSLDIASPSKRARDEIGKPVGQGIEQGVEESLKRAQSLNLADLRRYFNALKSEAKEGSAQLAALIAAGMAGMVQLPGGRQQRARIQQAGANVNAAMTGAALGGVQSRRQTRQEQSASAAATTPAFLASLPLLMGMKPQELQQRMLGLHGQQYRAPGIGGFTRPNERRIDGLIEMLASARGGLGAGGGALVARGPAGAMPSILPTGYRNAALPPSMVNYPPGMPAAYAGGFTGTSVGRFGMARASMEEPKVMGIFAAEVNRAVSAVKGFRQSLAKQAPALPPAGMTGLSAAQARRVEQAYRRSEERGAAVRAESMAALRVSPWGDGTVPARSYFAYGQGPQMPGFPLQSRLPGSAASGFRDTVVGGGGGGLPTDGGGGGGAGGGRGGALVRLFGGGYVPPSGFPSDGVMGPPRTRGQEALDRLTGSLQDADQYLRRARVPLAGAIEELGGEFAQATKQVLLYGTAYKALAFFMDLPNQALSAAAALQTFRNQLNAVTGSAENAGRSFSFIDGLADRFAVPLASIRQGFVRMYASMEPAGFGASEIEGLFSGISKAAATFGMSREQVDRVTYAFSQMASKGQIMAEELRGQLGDVLPGSLALFAKAAQMELPEFTKAMEDGRFSGEAMRVVLNNVAILLNQQFAKGAEGAAKTLQGALNQMQNGLQKLYEAFEPLVNEVAQRVFPSIAAGLRDATDAVKAFGAAAQGSSNVADGLSGNALAIFQVMNRLADIGRVVGSIFSQLAPTFAALGQAILTTVQFIANLVNTPIGLFLTSAAIKTAAFTAALQLLARAGLLAATSGVVRFARMLTVGLVPALSAATGAVRIFRLALTGIVAGGIILALEAVAGAVMGIGNNAKKSSADLANMRNELDRLAAAGMTEEVGKEYMAANTKLIQAQRRYNKALADLQKERERTSVRAMGDVPRDVAGAERAAQDALSGVVAARQALAEARKSRDTAMRVWTESQQQSGGLQPIPPGAGDANAAAQARDKAARDQQKEAERLARERERSFNQQQDLITKTAEHENRLAEIGFQNRRMLAEDEFDARKSFVDSIYDYELAGANEVMSVRLKLEKRLAEIRLGAIKTYQDAMRRLEEGRLKIAGAQRTRAAAAQVVAMENQAATALPAGAPTAPALPATGAYLQGNIGPTSTGPHFDVKRVGGGFFPRNYLDRFVQVNGRPLSSGVTVPGGTFAGHQRRGSHGWDYAFGPGRHAATLAGGAKWMEGVPTQHGERRRFQLPTGEVFQFLHGRSEGITPGRASGAPMSGPAFSVAKREQSIEFSVEEAKAEQDALIKELLSTTGTEFTKRREAARVAIAEIAGEVMPVEQLKLENDLLAKRGQLMLQAAPEEVIDFEENRAKALAKSEQIQKGIKTDLGLYEGVLDAVNKKIQEGGENTALYQKVAAEFGKTIASLNKEYDTIGPRLAQYNLELAKNTLAQLLNADALKQVRETIETIERVVGDAMGSYKNFLVNVARGEGLTKSLKEFQNALRDQALTLFFDFAMKPMQKFMEDSLKGLFGVPIEEQIRQEQIQKLQEQINLLTQIRDNTSVVGNAASTPLNTSGGIGGSGFLPLTGGLGEAAVNAPFSVDLRAMVEAEEGIRATSESMYQLGATMPALGQGVGQLTQNFAASAVQSGAAAKTLQQSLGATVQSIGMAAGAVMSIAGGVSQIKEGGVSGVLGGIGSILMGVGGAMGGFSKLGGLFGGGGVSAPNLSGLPQSSVAMGFAANGAVWKGGFTPFANGGVVQGPTLGLVGEGKYNEAIVPLPDGRSIPVKMAGGQSAREAMQTGGMASAGPSLLSFSFETTNIGGVEYVSRDQLELAMAATRKEAAKEGAKRGMDMTMDKIRNSPAARQSIAMGRR